MRILTMLTVITLLGCESQAQRQDSLSRGDDRSQSSPGCSLKVNDQKILAKDAVTDFPTVMENDTFRVTFTFSSGRLFHAKLLDKKVGSFVELKNTSSGILLANLSKNQPQDTMQLELAANQMEISSSSSSGDHMKLERDSKSGLAEAEIYWRSAHSPGTELNLSCDY